MAEYIERESIDNVLVDLLGDIENYEECSCDFARGFEQALSCVEDKVKDVPAADVRPERHGYWIDNTMWYGHLGVILKKCSACGFEVQGDPTSRKNGMGGKYCENCGAKMDGKGEE